MPTRGSVGEWLTEEWATGPIGEHTEIRDLAKDSMDLLEMVGQVEARFGVLIPDEKLAELRTVSDLIDCVVKV